jgi:hypothetical protein
LRIQHIGSENLHKGEDGTACNWLQGSALSEAVKTKIRLRRTLRDSGFSDEVIDALLTPSSAVVLDSILESRALIKSNADSEVDAGGFSTGVRGGRHGTAGIVSRTARPVEKLHSEGKLSEEVARLTSYLNSNEVVDHLAQYRHQSFRKFNSPIVQAAISADEAVDARLPIAKSQRRKRNDETQESKKPLKSGPIANGESFKPSKPHKHQIVLKVARRTQMPKFDCWASELAKYRPSPRKISEQTVWFENAAWHRRSSGDVWVARKPRPARKFVVVETTGGFERSSLKAIASKLKRRRRVNEAALAGAA